jgi:hypothetical protein
MCDISINVLLQTSALVGTLHVVINGYFDPCTIRYRAFTTFYLGQHMEVELTRKHSFKCETVSKTQGKDLAK